MTTDSSSGTKRHPDQRGLTAVLMAAVAIVAILTFGAVLLLRSSPESKGGLTPELLRRLEPAAQLNSPLAIEEHLAPTGRAARIGALLRHDGISMPLEATVVGTATIEWRLPGPKARLLAIVATGTRTFRVAPAHGRIRLQLSPAGRRLLRHATRLQLIARGSFVPEGYEPTEVRKTITLTR